MSEFQVLSTEEVEAILKATQEKGSDLSKVLVSADGQKDDSVHNAQALSNLSELVRAEFEGTLSSFLRKKAIVKIKSFDLITLSDFLKDNAEKKVFSAFHIMPNDHFGMFVFDNSFLHHCINLLFGGQLLKDETVFENVASMGIIIASKLNEICLTGFVDGCKEYGNISCEVTKTTHLPNLITYFEEDDKIYCLDTIIHIDESELNFKLLLTAAFLHEFIPAKTSADARHREKDFWRTAIQTQVIDSLVNVTVNLPDITMNVQDFRALKEGDLLPITDPTFVYVCLNNIKLFRAMAGQTNSKRVAKIVNQI